MARGTFRSPKVVSNPRNKYPTLPSGASIIPMLTIDFTPTEPLVAGLKMFNARINSNLMRQAVRSGMRPMRRSLMSGIRRHTRHSTGTLKRSIPRDPVIRQKTKANIQLTTGFVGALRGYTEPHNVSSQYFSVKALGKIVFRRKKPKAFNVRHVPTRYLHLFDKGFVHWITGKKIRGANVIQTAMLSTRQAAVDNFNNTLSRGINREWAKLSRKLGIRPQRLVP